MIRDLSCIGCGYCCSVRPCDAGQRVYNVIKPPCPGLVWDEESHRHWCKLAKLNGDLGLKYREELAIGTACSSTLFNDWREDIHDRTNKVVTLRVVELDKYFKVFIHVLSKQFISGDVKYMVIRHWAHLLREAGVPEYTIEAMLKEIVYIFTENTPSFMSSFMGDLREYLHKEEK